MSIHYANLGTLVISSGGTDSTAITKYLDDAKTVSIWAPATVTGTIGIEISFDEGTTYMDLTSGGSHVTIAGGNSVTITDPGFNGLRVISGSTETDTRTFTVSKTFLVGR